MEALQVLVIAARRRLNRFVIMRAKVQPPLFPPPPIRYDAPTERF